MLPIRPLVGRPSRTGPKDRPTDLAIAEVAAAQHGRVATRQLWPLGVTPSEVKRRVASGHLHREFRGVYAVGHPGATGDARRMAAVLACGEWGLLGVRSLCHHLGLLEGDGPATIDVIAAGRTRVGQPGIRVHLPRRITRGEVTIVRGVPCTTVERLLADMAAEASDAELATLVHRATVRGLVRPTHMAFQLARPAAGIGRLRGLIEPTGPDLRGELERRLHRFVRRGRWPRYEANVLIETPIGPFRADALWRESGLALELDSWEHHSGRVSFEADRERVVAASLVGVVLVRITWRMLTGTPAVLEALLDHHVGRSNGPPRPVRPTGASPARPRARPAARPA